MILQALTEYYNRKAADPHAGMAPPNWICRGVDFVVTLKKDGCFVGLECLQDIQKGKRRAKQCLVPSIGKQALKHTNAGDDANLLWDNAEFVFGMGKKGEKKQRSFIKTIEKWFPDSEDDGVRAIAEYLMTGEHTDVLEHPEYGEEIRTKRPVMAFRLAGDDALFVFDRPTVKTRISQGMVTAEEGAGEGICLVSGNRGQIAECHTVIKGVWGAQTSGAALVGFNAEAFCSHDKTQGYNAPVSFETMFAYTTALNTLLAKESKQRMQVGDASTVFWAEKSCVLEQQFSDFFGEPRKDDPDSNTRAIKSLFEAPKTGALSVEETGLFYVLGLAPNASRLSIRFWIVDSVASMAEKIRQHFRDIAIVHGSWEPDTLSLFRLLVSTAVFGEADNISPNLLGPTMRAILGGTPYPQTLLHAVIQRIRAEQAKKDKKTGKQLLNVTYPRAALIKAYLNRHCRYNHPENKEELHMSLDLENDNVGYRLGRLFAVLEKVQQEAKPGINATIRDRFYGAASGTPVTVFGNLMRLKNHHLSKLEGRRVYFEKLIGEIMAGNGRCGGISDFPAHLSLADQGRFAIGYYHQTQKFYEKKDNATPST